LKKACKLVLWDDVSTEKKKRKREREKEKRKRTVNKRVTKEGGSRGQREGWDGYKGRGVRWRKRRTHT